MILPRTRLHNVKITQILTGDVELGMQALSSTPLANCKILKMKGSLRRVLLHRIG